MFFMMGITDGRKDLDFSQQMICNVCGRYGRYQVFMTYTVLWIVPSGIPNSLAAFAPPISFASLQDLPVPAGFFLCQIWFYFFYELIYFGTKSRS